MCLEFMSAQWRERYFSDSRGYLIFSLSLLTTGRGPEIYNSEEGRKKKPSPPLRGVLAKLGAGAGSAAAAGGGRVSSTTSFFLIHLPWGLFISHYGANETRNGAKPERREECAIAIAFLHFEWGDFTVRAARDFDEEEEKERQRRRKMG